MAPFSWPRCHWLQKETSKYLFGDRRLNKEFIFIFIFGTKETSWRPIVSPPLPAKKCTLNIKGLSTATEVLIGLVQFSKISFCVNQLKQNNWKLSALLNIYASGCKYLFTYHLFAISLTSALCEAPCEPSFSSS